MSQPRRTDPARARRVGGFTLIELLVALSIAMLALGVAPFAISRAHDTMQYRATVKEFIASIKLARLQAMRSGRSAAFSVDLAERSFGVEPRLDHTVPDGLEIRVIVADVEIAGDRGGVRFYADGSSTGGSFDVVRASGAGVRIEVDWLLGRLSQTVIGGAT